eukprot:s2061_g4.t2
MERGGCLGSGLHFRFLKRLFVFLLRETHTKGRFPHASNCSVTTGRFPHASNCSVTTVQNCACERCVGLARSLRRFEYASVESEAMRSPVTFYAGCIGHFQVGRYSSYKWNEALALCQPSSFSV